MAWSKSLGICLGLSPYSPVEHLLGKLSGPRTVQQREIEKCLVWGNKKCIKNYGHGGGGRVGCERIYFKSKQLQFDYFKHVEGLLCLKLHAAQEFWFMLR